jgi:hypothetical protein
VELASWLIEKSKDCANAPQPRDNAREAGTVNSICLMSILLLPE